MEGGFTRRKTLYRLDSLLFTGRGVLVLSRDAWFADIVGPLLEGAAITASFLKRTLVTSLSREAIVADFSCSLDVLRQEGGL